MCVTCSGNTCSMTFTVRNCPHPSARLTQLWLAGSPKSLHLPGSHGHIFPWDPPSFGVPDEVLEKIAKTLQAEAVRLAIEDAAIKKSRSGQSSLASGSDDEAPVPAKGFTVWHSK